MARNYLSLEGGGGGYNDPQQYHTVLFTGWRPSISTLVT